MAFKFEKLEVWKLARQFTTEIYIATRAFPKEEIFGLTNQVRRAAVSIALNIAEGSNRGFDKEFSRFLGIARSSLDEVVTGLFIAKDQGFLEENILEKLYAKANEIGAKITAFQNKLK